ncbi:alpha/beta fold hydrolase [Tenggerimyces flavus]|uniref:Alpha/beta fold hydrolase n=1 Tax=Tenggerimyces flavus TaxID=1708749 RepID=A0ABV7YCI0_9ACTN|nr:alpha/beta hydrolase [Tenggerimyces flavus]MBM7787138.1 pimeloyl-ACP methyl ester carboxylesterase [Tenggerimyces flavus]
MSDLYARAIGRGSPSVLLECGVGHHSSYWGAVPDRIAAFTQAVCYDRRGLGRTPQRRGDLTIKSYLADVATVLPDGPMVLVGHSFGGFLIRTIAAAWPEQVQGMVFVDSATENELDGLPERIVKRDALGPQLMAVNAVVAGLGLGRLPSVRRRVTADYPNFAPAQLEAIVEDQASPPYWLANRAELRAYATFRDHVQGAVLPDVPLVYITATGYGEKLTKSTFAMSATEFADFHTKRQRAAFEQLTSHTEQLLAPTSGHLVQHDQPELIVGAVERLVELARTPPA